MTEQTSIRPGFKHAHRPLQEVLGFHHPPAQLFQVSASRRTTIVGNRGTRLTFDAFSFAGLEGQKVDGTVEIRLKEIFSQGEMMLADRPSTSEDRLMESGGQLMVHASQGHQPLKLVRPAIIGLPVRKRLKYPLAMRLFKGSRSSVQPFQFEKAFDWRQASDKPVQILKVSGEKYYHFELDDCNWVDCDFFIGRRSSKCMVTARASASEVEDFDYQMAYLLFKDFNAVARMYPGVHGFTAINIPEKLSATAHVISQKNEEFFYGKGYLNRVSDKLVKVRLRPISRKALSTLIQGL